MNEQSPFASVLAELETERDGLTAAINVIRRKMGLPQEGELISAAPATAVANGAGAAADTSKLPVEISADTFFGMKVPEAIRKYLAMTKRPAQAAAITKALLDGGLQSTAKDFSAAVQSSLTRMRGEIVKVPTGWALAEWYPGRSFDKPTRPRKAAGEKKEKQES